MALRGAARRDRRRLVSRALATAQRIVSEYVGNGPRGRAAQGKEAVTEEGHASEDLLGCSLEAHRSWLRTAPAAHLRTWAQDWGAS